MKMRLSYLLNDYKPVDDYITWEECFEDCSDHSELFYRLLHEYERDGRFRNPIIVDEDTRTVLDGHHRLAVLYHVGAETVTVSHAKDEKYPVEFTFSGEVGSEGYILMMKKVFEQLSYPLDKDTWVSVDIGSATVQDDLYVLTLSCEFAEKEMNKLSEIAESLCDKIGAKEMTIVRMYAEQSELITSH